MNTPTKAIGFSVFSAAAIPALLAQTPGSGINTGSEGPSSHRVYWIVGALVVLVVLLIVVRRKKT